MPVAVKLENVKITKEQRGDAEISLEKPQGELNGVKLDLYVRYGSKTKQYALGEFPDHMLDVRKFGIGANDMQMDDKVFVQATIVANQPAALQGEITFKGTLTIQSLAAAGGQVVSPLDVKLTMQNGKISDLVQFVWWVKP